MSAEDNQGETDREQEGSSEDERVVPYDQPYEDRMLNYIYDIRWHGSRLWEDDTVNIMDWNANAWSYAAQYDYLMDSWMISQGPGARASPHECCWNIQKCAMGQDQTWHRYGKLFGMQQLIHF